MRSRGGPWRPTRASPCPSTGRFEPCPSRWRAAAPPTPPLFRGVGLAWPHPVGAPLRLSVRLSPVASGGLCGVAGGGSPSRGRLPCPAASRRRPWAGLPRPVAGRPSVCRSGPAAPVARRLASPRLPSLGAFSRPVPHPPRLPRPSVRFSRPVLASPVPLTRVPCPLGAQLPVGAPSLRPRWWCVGGGRVPGNAGSGRGPPSGWAGARGRGPAGPAAPGV